MIAAVRTEFLRYKALAEGAIGQMSDADLTTAPGDDGNSVAVICQHVAGNLVSRFTDFLSTDGEKPWRDRDTEFAQTLVTRDAILQRWSEGWQVLRHTLDGLTDADLTRTVTIRQHLLSVTEALLRSLAHVSYHVGQIVLIAKTARGSAWVSLSIPRGQSAAYNAAPNREKSPDTTR